MTSVEAPRAERGRSARAVRLLVGGQAASTVGDGCFAVALPWFVLGSGGPGMTSAATLGATLTAYGVARAAAMPIGGHLCDRLGPVRVLLIADVLRAVLLVGLAVIASVTGPSVAVLLPVSALIGACQGAFVPGSFAVMPQLATGDLQQANALLSGALQIGSLVGPALGSAVVVAVGPAAAFGLDAATFAVSAVTLVLLRSSAPAPAPLPRAVDDGRPTLRAVFTANPALPVILGVVLAGNLASGGVFAVALPALAHERFGAAGLGLLLGALAMGALAGTALGARVRARRPAVVATAVLLAQTVAQAAIPYLGGLAGAAVAAAAFGVANAVGELVIVTAVQRTFPPAVLGRIMGLIMLASAGAFPVSVVLITALAGSAGVAAVFPVAGAISAAALLAALSQARFRRFGAEAG